MSKRLLRTGEDSEPIAQATEFGWVISGPATRSHSSSPVYSANHNHLQPQGPPLTDVVQEFWHAEEAPGDEEPSLSLQEEQVMSLTPHTPQPTAGTLSLSLRRLSCSLWETAKPRQPAGTWQTNALSSEERSGSPFKLSSSSIWI